MDPRFLRTFVTVAELGSFSAAAERLGYTQSGVSQHIASLEATVGSAVLHRRPVELTEVGERLLEHATAILLRLDAARADLSRLVSSPPSHLALAASPLAAPLAASALADLRRETPRLDASLRVASRDAVVAGVATGAFDIGLVDGIAAPGDPLRLTDAAPVTALAIAEAPLAVALPTTHPLAHRDAARLSGLSDALWIDAPDTGIPPAELAPTIGAIRLRYALRYEGCDVGTLLALIAAGHGLAVLPNDIARHANGIAALSLTDPGVVHRTEIVHVGTPSSTAAAFATALA